MPADAASRFDRVLADAVRDGELSGVAAAVTTPSGSYGGAAGVRRATEPMTADTVVRVASLTKAVTSVAAMRLVEDGLVELEQPLGTIVPYLGEVQVLDGVDDRGNPRLRPPRRPVTMRHLLTHTSGFGYDFADATLARFVEQTGLPGPGTGLRVAHELPLLFDPGERWCYGISMDWVGQVIEAVTGARLDEHLRTAVLDPLGMSDTGFRVTPEQRSRSAEVLARTPQGLQPAAFELLDEPEFPNAGGGLYSTALDYLRFLAMLLGDGELDGVRVLKSSTVREMARNQTGSLPVLGWRTTQPPLSNDVELFPGVPKGWGLGFLVTLAPTVDGRSAGSLSWAGILNTYYWLDRVRQVAGVFVTQVLPFFDDPSLRTFRLIERQAYSAAE
jgi:CubicO group peptidase (beta-lactamase class C family)